MKWIIRVYSFILLGYTGWRTYDFISSQLPKNDISFWLSIAFLFATEAGLLIWHEAGLDHVTTKTQESVSKWMTWIDFAGSLSAGVADMILRQTLVNGYQVPPALAQFLIYGLPVIMAANVAAVLIFQSNDAEKQLDRSKRQLRFEIYDQAMKELHENRGAIAEGMKKDIYRELKDDVTGKVARQFLRADQTPHPSTNGRAPVLSLNSETEAVANPTRPAQEPKQ